MCPALLRVVVLLHPEAVPGMDGLGVLQVGLRLMHAAPFHHLTGQGGLASFILIGAGTGRLGRLHTFDTALRVGPV